MVLAKKVYEYIITNKFKKAEVVNLVCNEYTSWYQFAKLICTHLRKEAGVKIIPVSTEKYITTQPKDKIIAMRPKYAVLDNSKAAGLGLVMPKWNTAFAEFIQKPYK
jgi:dTDP-4-dehydrorhamnose reductase